MYAKVGAAQLTVLDEWNGNDEPDPKKNHEVQTSNMSISIEKKKKDGLCVTIWANSTTEKHRKYGRVDKTHRVGYVKFTLKEIERILKAIIANKMPLDLPGLPEIREAQRLLEKAAEEMGASEL